MQHNIDSPSVIAQRVLHLEQLIKRIPPIDQLIKSIELIKNQIVKLTNKKIYYSEILKPPTLGTAADNDEGDFAVAAKGVTNGDTHDHSGGDGAQIAYSGLSGLPSLLALADIGSTAEAVGGSVSHGTATSAARSDHKHAITNPKIDDLAAADDNTDLNASTSKHGLVLKATAPASGLLNVLGIANGATVYSMKPMFDTTNPAALGTAGPGTQVIAARRDHIHAKPTLHGLDSLVDPNADRIAFWDDSEGALKWLALTADLAISTTNLGTARGTSFPVAPGTGDRYFRTDLGYECYYDGTRWLTVNEYITGQLREGAVDTTDTNLLLLQNSKHVYVTTISVVTYTATTNDASNYYTMDFYLVPIWGYYAAMSTLLHTFDTKTDGTANWAEHTGCNTAHLGASDYHIMAKITKTGSPGTLNYVFVAAYRLIIT